MAGSLVIRTGLTIVGSLPSGTGDPQLTVDAASKQVGQIPSVDPSSYLSTALPNGQIFVGNGSNLVAAVTATGAISITNAGVVTLNSGIVFNSNINALAAIDYSKLNLAGGIINNDINAAAAIARAKLANGTAYRVVVNNATGVMSDNSAITANRALISDANGLPTHSTVTSTSLAFLDATSSVQAQLNTKLTFTASPSNGDVIYYNSGAWNRLGIGSSGQVLFVSAGLPAWGAPTANGIPTGGTAGQYLNKIDATNYNTQWSTLVLASLTDVTASAAQVNVLATGFYDATSSVQTQLSLKLDKTLTQNYLFIGNISNVAVPFATGPNGYILTSVGGVPTWVAPTGGGTVTSVAASGGTTGLSFTGSPITLSGTLTLTGTLAIANGGTGATTFPGWLLASGGTLTGANVIVGTTTNTIQLKFDSLNTTQTDGAGLWLRNSAAAAAGAQQESPSIVLEAQGWKTTATAGTQTIKWAEYVLPVQDTTNPTSTWKLTTSVNGGAYSDVLTLSPWGASTGVTGTVMLIAGAGTDHRLAFNTSGSNHSLRSQSATGAFIMWAQAGYLAFNIGGNDKMRIHDGSGSGVKLGDVSIGSTTDAARFYVVQDPLTSAWNPAIRYDPGAHTAITIGSEQVDFLLGSATSDLGFNSGGSLAAGTRTKTWLDGTVAKQRDFYIRSATYNKTTTSATITNAYTLFIDSPVAGTGVTITNPYSLGVQGVMSFASVTRSGTTLNGELFLNSATGLLSIGTAGIGIPNMIINSRNGVNPDGTGGTVIVNDGGTGAYGGVQGASQWTWTSSGNVILGGTDTTKAKWSVVQTALSASWVPVNRYIPGNHTAMPSGAGSEFPDFVFGGAVGDAITAASTRTATWTTAAGGTVALQRSMYIRGTVLTGASATVTFTNAYTVYIDPPTLGTNATITNNYALGVNGNLHMPAAGAALKLTGVGGSVTADNITGSTTVAASSILYVGAGLSAISFTNPSNLGRLNIDTFTAGKLIGVTVTQGILTSGWGSVLIVTPGAHTGMTAGTQFIVNDFAASAQVWAAGAATLLDQRYTYFRAPQVFAGAGNTITSSYTVMIDGPTNGSGTTTNLYALGLSGNMGILVSSVGLINFTNSSTGNTYHFIRSALSGGELRIGGATGTNFITFYSNGAESLRINTANGANANALLINSSSVNAQLYALQSAQSGSSCIPALRIDPGTHTGMTTTTEFPDNVFSGSTKTWAAAGTAFTQRFTWFKGSTVATATGADAYTVYVDAPSGGATNYALGINGKTRIVTIPTNDNAATDLLVRDSTTGEVKYRTVASIGGGGITNTAANTELMMSNGTNAVPSGTFSTVAGNLTLGTGLAGTGRAIVAAGSGTDVNITLAAQGAGTVQLTASTGQVIFSTGTGATALQSDAGTNNLKDVFISQRQSSGTVAAGFGLTNRIQLENASNTIPAAGAVWTHKWTTATNGAEDMYTSFDSLVAGATFTYLSLDKKNIALFTATGSFATGTGVIFIGDRTTAPSTSPTGGGVFYSESGLPKWRDTAGITYSMVGGSQILTADVTLNQTQILALNTTPIQIVAAPGAGKFIQIIGPVIVKYVFNSAAFATNVNLRIKHGTAVTSNVLANVIDQAANAYGNFGSVQWTGLASTVENQAINIDVATGNPTGGGASSTLRVTFQYLVATL